MARLPSGRDAGRFIRRVVVTTIGTTLLCAGIVLLVLPGPGILLVLAGLAVLSTEYDWAKRAFEWVKTKGQQAKARARNRRGRVSA